MKPEKIAPGLMVVLEDYENEGLAGLTPYKRSLGLVVSEDSVKPPRTVVFIQCEESASFEELLSHNIQVNQPSGKVRTAFLPLEELGRLSDETAVERIIPSRYLRTVMDVAPEKVKIPEFRTRAFELKGHNLTGKGVIIGIVDTGIDPNHLAFKDRILSVWDQVLSGPGVQEGRYGVELNPNLLTVSRDTIGHGTHVAGIAAGAESPYQGIAPEANLVIVKSDLQDAHIADGIRYVFRIAEEMRLPAVVNLSLGGHSDAHDGTDPLSQIIDDESGEGRIVSCAAGNEGNDNIHVRINLSQDEQSSIHFRVPTSFGVDAIRIVELNGWYSGEDEIEVAVQSPSRFETLYQKILPADSGKTYSLPDARVTIFTPEPDPANNDHNFLIRIQPSISGGVTAGVWRLLLRGTQIKKGQVDVWVLDNSKQFDVIFTGFGVDDSTKIGSPGCAKKAITVASFTTKVEWKDSDSNQQKVGLQLNDISDFSSGGPLRNGTEKPDVAAPGAMIAAAFSADSSVTSNYKVAERYRINAGTSMATPFISGLVALLLQYEPKLTPELIKDLLKQSSEIPGKPAGTFDPKWGYGLPDGLKIAEKLVNSECHHGTGIIYHGNYVCVGGIKLERRGI